MQTAEDKAMQKLGFDDCEGDVIQEGDTERYVWTHDSVGDACCAIGACIFIDGKPGSWRITVAVDGQETSDEDSQYLTPIMGEGDFDTPQEAAIEAFGFLKQSLEALIAALPV